MSAGRILTRPWADDLRDRSGLTGMLLWGGAGLLAFAVHAGLIAWAMQEPPLELADDSPPPAIMIELAPEPEVIDASTTEISEQQQESVEVKTESVKPVEQPTEEAQKTPDEVTPVEQEPEKEITETTPETADVQPEEQEVLPPDEVQPVEELTAQLDNVEVPIPVARAEPPKPKKIEKKPPPKKVVKRPPPPPASEAAIKPAAQVRQAERNAAQQTQASNGFGSVSPAQWQSRLMSHLERRKRYPSGARSRHEEGTAYVRFRIDDSGNVLSASLARSSGSPELDAEVVDLARRASPVPAPPPGVSKTIVAPVQFTLN